MNLTKKIKKLYSELRKEKFLKWERDLPFDELLFDRWARAKQLKFGKNSSIYHNSYVFGKVKVGKDTWIGPFTILDGSGELEIGDNCSISSGVQIYTHNSVRWALSKGKESYDKKPVKIGSYCFIGPNTVIKNGVTIGEHTVIGACSFVNNNVEAYSIVAGIPAKKIGEVVIEKENIILNYFENSKSIFD